MKRFYDHLVAALVENRPFVLALILGTKGSSPQRIGAKALFFWDGAATLGGGCLEAEVHARARKALQTIAVFLPVLQSRHRRKSDAK